MRKWRPEQADLHISVLAVVPGGRGGAMSELEGVRSVQ